VQLKYLQAVVKERDVLIRPLHLHGSQGHAAPFLPSTDAFPAGRERRKKWSSSPCRLGPGGPGGEEGSGWTLPRGLGAGSIAPCALLSTCVTATSYYKIKIKRSLLACLAFIMHVLHAASKNSLLLVSCITILNFMDHKIKVPWSYVVCYDCFTSLISP
jgi:hypothetical protein